MIKNPLAYFHIATFLLSAKSRNLSEYWKAEVIMRDKFVLHRLIRNGMQRQRGFLMWWRLANGNDSNLLIVFYVQIMPDDLVMQLHRF